MARIQILCEVSSSRESVLLFNASTEKVAIMFGDCKNVSFVLSPGAYWEGNGALARPQISTTYLGEKVYCTTFSGITVEQPEGLYKRCT